MILKFFNLFYLRRIPNTSVEKLLDLSILLNFVNFLTVVSNKKVELKAKHF